MIQAQTGGDLFFIEVTNKYPANYNDTIDVAMQEQRDDARPALSTHVENMDAYDVIFLGYPNWWGTLPQPVRTFLDEYDFAGKTIIPFCTHEGSGFGRSVGDLEEVLPNSTLIEGFSVRGSSASGAGDDVNEWLAGLDLTQ
jgi:flavodoxin